MTGRRKKPKGKTLRAAKLIPHQRTDEPSKDHFKARDQRVHLIVAQTGPHGTQQLELGRPIFEHEWQNRLALATANTAFSALNQDFSIRAIAQLGEQALISINSLVTHLFNSAQPAIACGSGCDHCCHQRVGVTPLEAIVIALHVRGACTQAELTDLRLSLAAFVDKTRALSAAERFSPAYACPLLKDHRCSVYPVRPLSCRGVHSFDQQACASELSDPVTREAFLRGQLPGHAYREPVQAVYAVSAGLQLALHEQFALDMRPLDLAHALHELLRGEQALDVAQQWLDGLPVLLHTITDLGAKEGLDAVFKEDVGLAIRDS